MSIKIMTMVWDSNCLSGSELLALLALADYADDDGYCYPGYSTLASKVRVSERQVMRLVKSLEEQGYIVTTKDGNGRGNTNLFKINIKLLQKKGDTHDIKGDIGDTLCNKKGDIQRAKRVTSSAQKGDIQGNLSIYRSNIEPSIEPQPSGGGSSSPSNEKNGGKENELATTVTNQANPSERAAQDWDAVRTAYESEIGMFTAMTSETVHMAMEEYGAIMVVDAIKAASVQNVRKWAYVDGILKRWKANGRPSAKSVPVTPKLGDVRNKKNLPDYMKKGLGIAA